MRICKQGILLITKHLICGAMKLLISTTLELITDKKSNPSTINGNQLEGQEAQLNFDETLVKGTFLTYYKLTIGTT